MAAGSGVCRAGEAPRPGSERRPGHDAGRDGWAAASGTKTQRCRMFFCISPVPPSGFTRTNCRGVAGSNPVIKEKSMRNTDLHAHRPARTPGRTHTGSHAHRHRG
ncbi:unnamed protein product [Lampetra fluviatilis]